METDDDGIQHDCTATHQDPWSTGSKVPCCDGLEEELKDWDGNGKAYWKCMVKKSTGDEKCFKEFGCNNPASIDPDCDTAELCAHQCWGQWLTPC